MRYPFNKLNNYFLKKYKITENTEYELFDIYAKDLFTTKRIDLAVKYYYIECREKKQNLGFAKELYEKHIEAFTDGTFIEAGNPDKNSIEKYTRTFDDLIDDIRENGYSSDISIIPIGKNNELIDGSHRTACAAYFDQKIRVIRFSEISVDYGFEFFKRRFLDENYLSFIAKKFAMLNEDINISSVWFKISGNKSKKKSLIKRFCKRGRYVYRIVLNNIKYFLGKPI